MGNRTFQWSAKYETGLAEVDAQHHRLVDLINRLGDLRLAGAVDADLNVALDALADYAHYHFNAEEALMRDTGVDRGHYEAHQGAHRLFLGEIRRIVEEAGGDATVAVDRLLRFLVKWLAIHILGQDTEMAAEIKALQRGESREAARDLALKANLRSAEVLVEALNTLYDDIGAYYAELAAAQDQLQHSTEVQLKDAQRLAHIGSWELDLVQDRLVWSDETYRIFEVEPADFGASYEAFLAAVHPEDRERVAQVFHGSLARRGPVEVTYRLPMADGRVKHVEARYETRFAADGSPLSSIGTIQDVSDRVRADAELRENQERLRAVADFTYDWEYWLGPQRELLYISPACHRVTGYSASEFLVDPELFLRIVHPEDRHRLEQHLVEEFQADEGFMDFRIRRRDGEERWIAHGCRPVFSEQDGRFLGRRANNHDITDRKALETVLQSQAQTDPLTGLANRRHFLARAEDELSRARRYGHPFALLMLDVDHFKEVNDVHGHEAGDLALQQVAALCREMMRSQDIIGRLGGEEFAIVLPETDAEEALAVAERLRQAIACKPLRIGQEDTLELRISIGVTALEGSGEATLDLMLRRADQALYEAKEAGRNRVALFRKSPNSRLA